ncbi:transcriptional regulator domain-containing protein [Aliihoeflea sp. PC F10.4]
MIEIDWRSPAEYRHARTITAAGFAWEYLRRHPEYRHDVQRLTLPKCPAPDQLERFTERWGLRFSTRPGQAARQRTHLLVATAEAAGD